MSDTMRRPLLLVLAVLCGTKLWAQSSTAPVQTARQALLEMFFSKTPGTLTKHLPAATLGALEKSGALANLQQYSQMASQFQAEGQNVQTFETGSIMISSENSKTGEKMEIIVESDSLRGDQDDIEVLPHIYKNGQEQPTSFMPQITFSMKQEERVWKLNEVSVTLHLPLADPALLKAISEKMTPHVETTMAIAPHGQISAQTPAPVSATSAGSDAMVLTAMRTILFAETTYAQRYPAVGYTCSLSSLDGFGAGEPNEHQAMLIHSGLASGKRYGFVFTVSDCSGNPATTFHLTAAPNANTFGRKAFCTDQSGAIRSSDDGNAATCVAVGTPAEP